jgi:hypothetical protein
MSTFNLQPEPPVLLTCRWCQLVHDETFGWMTKKSYRDMTGIDPMTRRLAHTYCLFCYDFLHRQAA